MLGEEVWNGVRADWRTAPVEEGLRATLGLLQKLTLDPDGFGRGDVSTVRAAGVSDEGIVDAIHVCALFNVIDRIADALSFHVPPPEIFAAEAPAFLKRGYK